MPPDAAALAIGDGSAFAVWLLGATLGMTACAVSCLPFIGTWAFARGGRGRAADTAAFLGGRLLAYTLLGGLAGGLGRWFVVTLASGWGNAAIGASAVASALWLAWPRAKSQRSCAATGRLAGLSPLLMGAALTLIPCAPLATLLAACAAGGDAGRGAWFGLLFGSGALLTPLLILIPAAGGLARRMQAGRGELAPWLRGGAALVLAALGLRRIAAVDAGLASAAFCFAAVLLGMALLLARRDAAKPAPLVIPVRAVRE